MNLDDALAWFRLDATTVNEARLNKTFRRLAKELHPDTKKNYTEKLAAHDNFVAALQAKEIIAESLRQVTLPRVAERSIDDSIGFEQDEENNYTRDEVEDEENVEKHDPYEDTLTGRDKYDYHNPLPLERLMNMPIIGPIIAIIVGCGAVMGSMAGWIIVGTLYVPFQLLAVVYLLASTVLEVFGIELPMPDLKWDKLWDRLGNMAKGLPLFLVYYALTFAGAKYIALVNDPEIFPYVLGPMWLTITLMALDEIYSLVRYAMIARKFKGQVAAIITEED